MKNKYLLFLLFVTQPLFLTINCAFGIGNTAYGNKSENLNILLKKYNINLSKPEIMPINSKKIFKNKRKIKRQNHINHISTDIKNINKDFISDFLKQKVSLAGDGSVKSALMLLSREIGVPIILHRGFGRLQILATSLPRDGLSRPPTHGFRVAYGIGQSF